MALQSLPSAWKHAPIGFDTFPLDGYAVYLAVCFPFGGCFKDFIPSDYQKLQES